MQQVSVAFDIIALTEISRGVRVRMRMQSVASTQMFPEHEVEVGQGSKHGLCHLPKRIWEWIGRYRNQMVSPNGTRPNRVVGLFFFSKAASTRLWLNEHSEWLPVLVR